LRALTAAAALAVAAALLAAAPRAARADDALAREAQRRNDELVAQAFRLTQRLTFGADGTRLELFVPPPAEEHEIALWFAAPSGTVTVRLVGPAETLASWSAAQGELRFTRVLAPGRYVVEAGGAAGRGLVGVKGAVVATCPLDRARLVERPAAPAQGFHWPYLLFTPKSARPTTLLVLPNNSGFTTEDLSPLRASATCQLAAQLPLADALGSVAVLVPLFPRPAVAGPEEDLYLHALTRAALTTRTPRYARVDRQLIAMIDDARAQLGGDVDRRVLITGFSAAGSFANRFAVLHPERVRAAAVGSPGGWPLAPVPDPALAYPVGIADVAALTGAPIDRAALRRVAFFFFLGGDDTNDAVPFRDSFSAADEALLMRRFGATPVARWSAAERLYKEAQLRATFRLYPGVGHTISPAMSADIAAAFQQALATP
jgi:dienelactone hydrolase